MKKIFLLAIVGAFFISSKSEGQSFIASFGAQVQWNVPQRVYHTIGHDFYGYNWVHATRVSRGGHFAFDVILQRGDVFVEVNLGYDGHVIGRTYFDYYPLHDHVCNGYCGYHADYYTTYRSVCDSHHHHGHNHVVYRPVVYHNHIYNKPQHGHAYGHYKKHNNKHYHNRVSESRPLERRDRYYDSHRDHSSHNRYSESRQRKSYDHPSNNGRGRGQANARSVSSRRH